MSSSNSDLRPSLAITDLFVLVTVCAFALAFHQQFTWYLAVVVGGVGAVASAIPIDRMLSAIRNNTARRIWFESLGRIYSALVLSSLLLFVSIFVGIVLVFIGIVNLASMGEVIRHATLGGLVAGSSYPRAGLKAKRLTYVAGLIMWG